MISVLLLFNVKISGGSIHDKKKHKEQNWT